MIKKLNFQRNRLLKAMSQNKHTHTQYLHLVWYIETIPFEHF